jgi:Transposase DDE domain group 1
MRSPALVRTINALTPTDYKTITLDRAGRYNRPKVHETTGVRLSNYPGTVRQLIVTGLGRPAPTVIITNDTDLPAKALIEHYARRMTIEQRLAEIIQAFHADALSSTVNLNVDLDIMLSVLAQALIAALRARLPGYSAVTPDTLQRRFLETPGQIITTNDTVTVRLERRAYSPVLRQAELPNDTRIPWWGNRTIRYELT